MSDRHSRSFWILLWEGFKQNWTGWQPGDDGDEPHESVAAALRQATRPYSDYTYQVRRQYPIASNDANRLVDRLVDEEMVAVEDLPV
jgi:hypothetical protein